MTSKTIKVKIEDNFLDQEKFDEIQQLMANPMVDTNPVNPPSNFPWYFRYRYYAMHEGDLYYIPKKDENELDQFQFTHTFYDNGAPQSTYMDQSQYFVDLLQPVAIFRIRANLLTRLPNIIENEFHTDMPFLPEEKLEQWTTSIFYVNTNDGHTVFEDGTKVESVANRIVIFPTNTKHRGTSCTDERTRVVINFNYLIKNEIVSA